MSANITYAKRFFTPSQETRYYYRFLIKYKLKLNLTFEKSMPLSLVYIY